MKIKNKKDLYISILSSFLDFMTDKQLTFDECIAEQGKPLLQPKKQLSKTNVVDQLECVIMMCKIRQTSLGIWFDQLKHYPKSVMNIN
jgi:hypothetical protein